MYELYKLPYLFQDTEPYIDIHTMGVHYHKHATNYLNKLNELLIQNNYDFKYKLPELVFHIDEFPKDAQKEILFNLGGVLNHNLYWKSINPNKREKPVGQLKKHIEDKYGGIDEFWKEFKDSAMKLKGSGYTFLILKSDKTIDIINTTNQDTPLSLGHIPLFNVDMWEHAYYLNYKNEKLKYLDNFEQIADFENANHIFNKLI